MKLSCNLSHFCINIFLLILIFNKVANEEVGNPGLIDAATETHSILTKNSKNSRETNVDNTVISDSDPEYPYEKLLQLVKETKRILTSTNATAERRMLKLNPSDYANYLAGYNLNGQSYSPIIGIYRTSVKSSAIDTAPPFGESAAMGLPPEDTSSTMDTCGIVTQIQKPDRLKSIDGSYQFILNLGDEFVQEWLTIKCSQAGEYCGSRSIWPEMYESVCEQKYSGTAKFFSVPVGQPITLSQQELREFKLPLGCNCKLRLATSTS